MRGFPFIRCQDAKFRQSPCVTATTPAGRPVHSPRESRKESGIILRALRHLDQRHAYLRGEELLGIGTLVCVEVFVVFEHEVHLLDALIPEDVVVLPELRHVEILLDHTRLGIRARADAAVAVILAFVRDVSHAPRRGLVACWFFEYFEAQMSGAVAVIDRRRPVLRPLRIQTVVFEVVVRLAGLRVQRILLREGEGHIKEHKLLRVCGGGDQSKREKGEETVEHGDDS